MATITTSFLVEATVEYDDSIMNEEDAMEEAFHLSMRPNFAAVSNGVYLTHICCSADGVEFCTYDKNGNLH